MTARKPDVAEIRPLLMPICFGQTQRAWPKHPDARPVPYLPLHIALTKRFATDAHMAAYSVPTWPRRLSRDALGHPRLPDGVPMALAIFDVDCPVSHTTPDPHATDAWWGEDREKLQALHAHHPDLFIYRTRGGYRILGILPEPVILRTPDDAALWSQRYLMWCASLVCAFTIHADPACKDWTRLYRLPHATRDPGGRPEAHPTLGNAHTIGIWICEPTSADRTQARQLGRRTSTHRQAHSLPRTPAMPTGEGVLSHLFLARGWIGHAIDPRTRAVVCPWEASHTKGERFDTSSVLFLPRPGDPTGWFHCSHAHCQGRTLRDVLRLFTTNELDRAREQAGLPPPRGRLRATGTTGGLRTVQAARVPLGRTIPASEVKSWR